MSSGGAGETAALSCPFFNVNVVALFKDYYVDSLNIYRYRGSSHGRGKNQGISKLWLSRQTVKDHGASTSSPLPCR